MKPTTAPILVPLGAAAAQVLAYFWVSRWSDVSPASSSVAFLFVIACAWLFYLLPFAGIYGAVQSVRRFREKARLLVVSGVLLNLCFADGGGLWALHGL
jgi:hypothetical protein